jgi:hypothetical protein
LEITSTPNLGTRVVMKFPSQASAAAPRSVEQRNYG